MSFDSEVEADVVCRADVVEEDDDDDDSNAFNALSKLPPHATSTSVVCEMSLNPISKRIETDRCK